MAHNPLEKTMWSTAKQILKISRPAFWPTQLFFYLLPFAKKDMFSDPAFWVGATYVCFPLGLLLYGWNDISDAETDKNNPRKGSWIFGARPGQKLRSHLVFYIVGTQLPFAALFVYLAGPKMLLWFLALTLMNALYNNLGFKRLPVVDLLSQAGYALVFVLASALTHTQQLNTPAMIFGALFAMQSHLFGQLMDVDEDKSAGRKTTAILVGIRPAKILLVLFLVVLAALAYFNFKGQFVAYFLGAGALFFALDAAFGPRRYPLYFLKLFFISWNLVVIATMHFVWRFGVFLER